MKRFLALAICVLCMVPTVAAGQGAYPTRPIKIVCGFPAGSSLDVLTRIYADRIEKALGQPVVVENRVGQTGNIAADAVARTTPDGYTLVTNGVTMPIAMSLFRHLPFDVVNDFTPLGFMGNIPILLSANATLGVKSVAELIALAKSK